MDSWLHEHKSMWSFYSREDKILDNGDEETTQKISQLNDIRRKYTVSFALYVLKLPTIAELNCLTSTCRHLRQSDAINWWGSHINDGNV
jgi:CRISPR/Cas system CMR-associated protein Cmr5 small subunit